MTEVIATYAHMAEKLLDTQPQDLLHSSPFLQSLPSRADIVLAEADRAVSLIERDSHRRTLLLQSLGMIGMFSGLLLLGSVYLLILKPLVRRVEGDIAARKQAAQAIETARLSAEASSRAKTMFLANMSHELRSPLNAVIGFADMMEQQVLGPLGNERYRDYAKGIGESGRHLLDLIIDVLDMARDEAGKLAISEQIVAPQEILERVRFLLERQAGAKGVTFRLDSESGLPPIHADPLRLRQVLINLGVNAIKFTPSGGAVNLAARRAADGGLIFEVSDTGIGIAPEDVSKAFEVFGQVEGRHQDGQGGAGLGLPLSRRLIELHGGQLDITSHPGAGTTITCRLPPSRIAREAHSASPPRPPPGGHIRPALGTAPPPHPRPARCPACAASAPRRKAAPAPPRPGRRWPAEANLRSWRFSFSGQRLRKR
jgi:signal transduction histidine kinase